MTGSILYCFATHTHTHTHTHTEQNLVSLNFLFGFVFKYSHTLFGNNQKNLRNKQIVLNEGIAAQDSQWDFHAVPGSVQVHSSAGPLTFMEVVQSKRNDLVCPFSR